MTTVFLAMLVGVLTVGLVGLLSARAAKRRAERMIIAVGPPKEVTVQTPEKTAESELLAAVGAGQTNASENVAHSKARGN